MTTHLLKFKQPHELLKHMLDKVLESTLNQEFDSFFVLARHPSHWEAIRTILVELNELDYAMLNRLLERCCRISWEYIEDNGGLFDVLTADEMLEADMAADRKARRESRGFVSASAAADFLKLTRTTTLKNIIASRTTDSAVRSFYNAAGVPDHCRNDQRTASSGPFPAYLV